MAVVDCSKSKLKILAFGRTGVGKSSLINSLLGKGICRVSDKGLHLDGLDPCTLAMKKIVVTLSGREVEIYDSPGLQDGDDTIGDETYVEEMYSRCNDCDIFLYCMNITNPRFENAEARAIELITGKFGTAIWNRCVLVLTRANCLYIPASESGTYTRQVKYHQTTFLNLKKKFCSVLSNNNVPQGTCDHLDTVAAGHYDYQRETNDDDPERYIHFASERSYKAQQRGVPPSEQKKVDFIGELWATCLKKLPEESCLAFLQATALGGRITQNGVAPTGLLKIILEEAAKLDKEIKAGKQIVITEFERPGIDFDDHSGLLDWIWAKLQNLYKKVKSRFAS